MSDPRLPEDGPNWPERDLEENRAEEPAAGWSDDPYRFEPLLPNKPSDEPLEGEWSDSEPFDPEPLESDPFAPAALPPQDDTWGFPPRAEPTYEPAPTEPELVAEPAWESEPWAEPQPEPAPDASEPEPMVADEPAPDAPEAAPEAPEPEPMVADEPAREAPEAEPTVADEPAPEAPEPEPMAADQPEGADDPEAAAEAPEPEPSYGYAPQVDAEPATEAEWEPEPVRDAGPEPEPVLDAEPEPEPELELDAVPPSAMQPEPARDLTDEAAAAAFAAEGASGGEEEEREPVPALEPDSVEAGEIAAAALAADAATEEPDWEPEPSHGMEPFPEPIYEADHDAGDAVAIEAAAATIALGGEGAWDPKVNGNRRRPTTAEQAVPWLIGIILALAGMVIVLLALIFSSPNGLVASDATATPDPSGSGQPGSSAVAVDPSAGPSGSGNPSPSASAEATPEPTAQEPPFGALEMTYLGRPQTTAPIYLMLRDFGVAQNPDVVARADEGVSSYANAPNGRVSAAVIGGKAVAIDRSGKTRRLVNDIRTVTFGWDAETVYAVRVVRDGNNDLAKVLEVDFVSGATKNLATIRYPHPVTGAEAPLKEAQFIDNGGLVRLYAVADGNLTLWVLGAPATYRIDPANGDVTEIGREPILWSPDGTLRVTAHEDGNKTALRLRDRGNNVIASTGVNGLVSHIRWAGGSNEIVFTLGVQSASGGVRQDLYVWDLEDRRDPMPLTSSGAAFGAEWRGVMSNWGP